MVREPTDLSKEFSQQLPDKDAEALNTNLTTQEQERAITPPTLGSPQVTLTGALGQRREGWAVLPENAAWSDDLDSDAVLGVQGMIYAQEVSRHWSFTTHLQALEGSIEECAVGIKLANNHMISLTLRNLAGLILYDIQTIDISGQQITGHLAEPAELPTDQQNPIIITVSHIGQKLSFFLNGDLIQTITLTEPGQPAIWVDSKQGQGIIAIQPGSTLSQSMP